MNIRLPHGGLGPLPRVLYYKEKLIILLNSGRMKTKVGQRHLSNITDLLRAKVCQIDTQNDSRQITSISTGQKPCLKVVHLTILPKKAPPNRRHQTGDVALSILPVMTARSDSIYIYPQQKPAIADRSIN